MKTILLTLILISPTIFAKQLGFTCKAKHRINPVDKIFFNIILDTETYDQTHKSVNIFVYHQIQLDMSYDFIEVNAFYVSPSTTNPQFYIRAKNIPYYEDELSFEVYPLAEKMLGNTNLTITKNGNVMDGTCIRADYLDAKVL